MLKVNESSRMLKLSCDVRGCGRKIKIAERGYGMCILVAEAIVCGVGSLSRTIRGMYVVTPLLSVVTLAVDS